MVGDLLLQSLSHGMFKSEHAPYGATEKGYKEKAFSLKLPVMLMFGACLVVPLFIFALVFYIRSFEIRYESPFLADVMCYILLLVPLVVAIQAWNHSKFGLDSKPMTLLFVMTSIAWGLGFSLGGNNFHHHMQPFYDINRMNVYPSVDPASYTGQQLMDAGQIQFTPGTRLGLDKSMGFIDGDAYCVAPIVTGKPNVTQTVFDFWAVGVNCCSGHLPDFHCGEYSNPRSIKGLRLMDNDKRDMFQLVVQKAVAEYNIKVSHPMFMYWLSRPEVEVQAYQDDGYGHFLTATAYLFCAQLFTVACAAMVFAKI